MYHATATGGEDLLRKHMADVIDDTQGYAIGDRSWRPPSTWANKKQMVVKNVKDWLVQATPDDKSGTVTPVVEVAKSTFSIFTTTNGIYRWRRRLCESAASSTALRAPSWDPKTPKTRFMFMLPELARLVLAEFTLMDKQLQATVTNLPMAAVTGPSPTKADLKKRDRESMDTIAGLTSANATLSAENASMAEDLEAEVNVWENSLPFFLCHFAIFLNFMFAIFATALADPPLLRRGTTKRSRRTSAAAT